MEKELNNSLFELFKGGGNLRFKYCYDKAKFEIAS